jgi:hypothetical protein
MSNNDLFGKEHLISRRIKADLSGIGRVVMGTVAPMKKCQFISFGISQYKPIKIQH